MITRVTHQSTQRAALTNLQATQSRLAQLQERASSGKMVTKASDDPAKAADAMALRKEQQASAQYSRNIQDGVSWLTSIDTAINTSVAYLNRVRDLTVRGANTGAINAEAREALAVEIEGLRESLAAQANTTYLGRSVFAGTSDGPAYTRDTVTGEYTYNSSAGTVERRTGAGTTVRVDADGAAVFGTSNDPDSPDASVYALLTDIAATLRAGGDVQSDITRIDARRDKMLSEVTGVGARTNQLESAKEILGHKAMSLKGDLSAVEDIDLPATLIELQMQEVAYQAALGATARVLQPSLLDYLK
ncbi:flagellar hook-associated protein 3 [Sanguibacter keddieii DSM 10542]|uniref:Flagellar hook-associated protein 3 n=1 Tax=Sanguibacter keddieii (strain ATCC 51767 / DSM 10542 / NCFB 3025 / ST-74) TaxID=446469 RepID=D1BD27_SANKS|nr:flagellar hook-associated protein FlgL [Sanguibacter keddieii]ACZ23031.1 flagellar hook-associated protein 3 [Sanguibacter keddieii DSM 10542]